MSERSDAVRTPLVSSLAGDPEMAELIGFFIGQLPERVAALTRAAREGKSEEIQRIAHQLRGASAGYGFAPIGQAAGQVEDAVRRAPQKTPPSSPGVGEIQNRLDELLTLCRRACQTPSPSSPPHS